MFLGIKRFGWYLEVMPFSCLIHDLTGVLSESKACLKYQLVLHIDRIYSYIF